MRAQRKIKNLRQSVKSAPSAFQKKIQFNLCICGNPKKPKDLGNQAASLFVIFWYIYRYKNKNSNVEFYQVLQIGIIYEILNKPLRN